MAVISNILLGSLLVCIAVGIDSKEKRDDSRLRGNVRLHTGNADVTHVTINGRQQDISRLLENCCVGEVVLPGQTDMTVVAAVTKGSDVSFLENQPYEAHLMSDVSKEGTRRAGYESAAYARYIIDHYDELPDKMAFMHGHKAGWEIGNESQILTNLNKDSYDYMGLSGKWAVDLRDPDIADTRKFLEDVVQDGEILKKFPAGRFDFSFASGGAFLVSSKRVKLHDKATWQRIFDWLQTHPSKQDARALEFSWHMLMGENAQMTPPDHKVLCPGKPEACAHRIYADKGFPPSRLNWYAENNPKLNGEEPL